jgi:hypothetical protein
MEHGQLWKHVASGLVVLVLVALAIGSSGSKGSSSSTPEATRAPTKISAWVMAQQFVKDRLKSPGSADFGGVFSDYQSPDEVVTDLGGGSFRVRAWVDSQNVFGAKLRTRFLCELKFVGNDRWQLTSLEFLE